MHALMRIENPDLYSLRLFLAVCDTKSILKVAYFENIVPSAISKRMAKLESIAKVPLLKRLKNGVEPTLEGLNFARLASELVRSSDIFNDGLKNQSVQEEKIVNVMSVATLMAGSLGLDIVEFLKIDSSLKSRIIIKEGDSNKAVTDAVRAGAAPFGVIWDKLDTSGLESRPYRKSQLVVVMHKTHPLTLHDKVNFSEVAQFDYIGMRSSRTADNVLFRKKPVESPDHNYRIETWTCESTLRLVGENMGVTVLPKEVAEPYLDIFNLCTRPVADAWANITNKIIFQSESRLTPANLEFIDYISRKIN